MNYSNQETVAVEEVVRPFLKPLESAVRRGQWEGIDGARKCFENPRLSALDKLYSSKVQRAVLAACFSHMARIAEEAREGVVIREFAQANPAIIHYCAEHHAEVFRLYPSALRYCMNVLKPGQQKKLNQLLEVSNDSALQR